MSLDTSLFDPRVPDIDPGDIIGFRASGEPVFAAGGGARDVFGRWVPE